MSDSISRQAVMDALCEGCELFHRNGEQPCLSKCEEYHFLAVLPSTDNKSEPRMGHWICHEEEFNALGVAVKGGVKCSECGYTTHNKLHMEIGCPFKFCPNCGADMRKEGEQK